MLDFLLSLFKKTQQDIASSAFANLPIATIIINECGVIEQASDGIIDLTGYVKDELVGKNMSFFKSGKHNHAFYKALWTKLTSLDRFSFEVYNKKKSGKVVLIKSHIKNFQQNGKKYFLVTQEDITKEDKLFKRQKYLATHDQLTGLANRTLLHDRYEHAVSNSKRNYSKLLILLCDLNEFKQINDDYGHNFGDLVLKEVSDNLSSIVREGDTVARYGGDEFIIIVENFKNSQEVLDLVKNIKSQSNIVVNNGEVSCPVTMSIGHATFPDAGVTFEQLVAVADIKMYENKNNYYRY